MRLSDFIRAEMDAILSAWEAFAGSLVSARAMSPAELRDHAREILEAIATSMESPQSRDSQARKSKGLDDVLNSDGKSAAQVHAVQRAGSAFDINETVAEYRALRASVLRLWKDANAVADDDFDDMLRFNEAIDQAIAESVAAFESHIERTRNLLLGMLGHDMRSPLMTIQATAEYLGRLNAGGEISTAAARLIRSGRSMKTLLDDLVDFNRMRFGLGVRIHPQEVDLARVAEDEVEQQRAAHPGRSIDITVSGKAQGRFDSDRVQQLLRNLLSNALMHGAKDSPIAVSVMGTATDVALSVVNQGEAITAARLPMLFDPLVGGEKQDASGGGSLGLGLYVVREIAIAHGGRVEVSSDAEQTRFEVVLPKAGAAVG